MFPLKQRKIGGYKFSEKTFYSDHHLGTDYVAKMDTPLYAPFDGKIIDRMRGAQGGLTIWFQPEGSTDIIRFMHLSEYRPIGKYKEGDLIGLTGNTGSATTGAHLHIDISKKKVDIKNWKNFKDPEKYKWDTASPRIEPTAPEAVQVPVLPQEPTVTPNLKPSESLEGDLITQYLKEDEEIQNPWQKYVDILEEDLKPWWQKLINKFLKK